MNNELFAREGFIYIIKRQFKKSPINVMLCVRFVMCYVWVMLYVLFTHQQMHYFILKQHIKIYTKIHINIPATCFGLRPSSESLH